MCCTLSTSIINPVDGTIDEDIVYLTEPVVLNEFEAADHVFDPGSAFGAITVNGATPNGMTLELDITPANPNLTGSAVDLDYTYTNAVTLGSLRDAAGNTTGTLGGPIAQDDLAPVFVTILDPVDGSTGVTNRLYPNGFHNRRCELHL